MPGWPRALGTSPTGVPNALPRGDVDALEAAGPIGASWSAQRLHEPVRQDDAASQGSSDRQERLGGEVQQGAETRVDPDQLGDDAASIHRDDGALLEDGARMAHLRDGLDGSEDRLVEPLNAARLQLEVGAARDAARKPPWADPEMLAFATMTPKASATPTATPNPASSSCTGWVRIRRPYR